MITSQQYQMTPSLKKNGKVSSDYLIDNREREVASRKFQGHSSYSGYPPDPPQFATPSYGNYEGGQKLLAQSNHA